MEQDKGVLLYDKDRPDLRWAGPGQASVGGGAASGLIKKHIIDIFRSGGGRLLLLAFVVIAAGVLVQHLLDIRLQAEGFYGWKVYIPVGIVMMVLLYKLDIPFPAKKPVLIYGAVLLNSFILLLLLYYAAAGYSDCKEMYYITIAFIPLYAGAVCEFRNRAAGGIVCCTALLAAGILPSAAACSLGANSAVSGAALIFLITGTVLITGAILSGHFGGNKRKELYLFWGLELAALAVAWAFGLFQWMSWTDGMDIRTEMVRAFIGNAGFTHGLAATDMNLVQSLFYPAALDNFITHLIMKYGVWSGLAVIVLFTILVVSMLRLAHGQTNSGKRTVAISIAIAFAISGVLYAGTNLGAFSLYGIILPFISWGKTGFFMNAVLFGLFLSCCRIPGMGRAAENEKKVQVRTTAAVHRKEKALAQAEMESTPGEAEKRLRTAKETFLEAVCCQIRCKKAHPLVKEELEAHISDQLEAYVERGMGPGEAEETAVKEMGDPEAVGQQLDQTHRPKPEWKIIVLMAAITLMSGFIQWALDIEQGGYIIGNWMIYAPLGLAIMAQLYFADFTYIGRRPAAVYLGLTLINYLLLSIIRFSSLQVYWYRDGISACQFYLVLLSIPFFAAVVYQFRGDGIKGIFACMALLLAGMAPSFAAPSMTGGALLGLAGSALVTAAILKGYFGKGKKRLLACFWGTGTGAICVFGGLLRLLSPYRFSRLLSALFPFAADSAAAGWRPSELYGLLSNCRFLHGISDMQYGGSWMEIKESHSYWSSYLLNFLAVKYGVLASLLVIAAFTGFLICLAAVVRKQKNSLSWLTSASVVCAFGSAGLIYVLNNAGVIFFAEGILPFISADVTGYLICSALLGLFLSACKGNFYLRDRELECNLEKSIHAPWSGYWIDRWFHGKAERSGHYENR